MSDFRPPEGAEPACLNADDDNLKDQQYCWFCEMPWYNCLCSHDDDEH